jgi:hypothetical protein
MFKLFQIKMCHSHWYVMVLVNGIRLLKTHYNWGEFSNKSWIYIQGWGFYLEILCTPSWQELQVYFKLHPNRRFGQRVMTPQSGKSPNRDNFETPPWESHDKKPFRCRCRGDTLPTPQRTQMWAQVGNSGRRRNRGTLLTSQHFEG